MSYGIAQSHLVPIDANTLGNYIFTDAVGATSFANFGSESVSAMTVAVGTIGAGHIGPMVGRLPGAVRFGGTQRLVTAAAAHQPATAITISLWIRWLSAGGLQWLALKPSNTTWTSPFAETAIKITGAAKIDFEVRNVSGTSAVVTSTNDLSLSDWVHIAGTYDSALGSNQMKLYINGVLNGQGTQTGNIRYQNNQPWSFGAHNGNSELFNGYMSDIRIESVARDAAYLSRLVSRAYLL